MTDATHQAEHVLMMQAAHWCVRLREADCSLAERQAFEDWLQSDTSHGLEYAKIVEVWDLCGQLTPSLP
ncbi:transmembrane sensor [Pseudomonas saponiphila]|uniref:Transmembrane sensor n=1 Tax=Pseudomonas saponiphila TaxID=556534 RepID=A0A1H4NXP4_9PSED|nr:DUF4880 domain-containing protein [Pseudomonas saponiphila]SEB99951.1 transmembrane sensor [Pseudomonas saponiphila]